MSQIDGRPRCATIITGTVSINNSSMIRGLVSATYAPIALHPLALEPATADGVV